jgi:hypothetical protein
MRRHEEAVIHATGFSQVVSNVEVEEEDRRRNGPQKETAAPATKGEREAAIFHSTGFLQVCSVDETHRGWRQRRSPEKKKKETGKGTAREQQETVVQSRCAEVHSTGSLQVCSVDETDGGWRQLRSPEKKKKETGKGTARKEQGTVVQSRYAEVDWGSEVDQRSSSSETQARTFPEIGNSSHSWGFGIVAGSGWDSGPSNASGWDDEQQDTTAAVTNERNEGWGQIEEIPFTSLDVSSFDCCDTEVEVLGEKVLVTVAATAATVESWVAEHQGQTMFGFDIEWRPTFQKGDYHEASLLQLSVEKRCLLVQLFFMDFFPESLKSLLADPQVILAGVGIRADTLKLKEDHGLVCSGEVDLGVLASTILRDLSLKKASMVTLTERFLGVPYKKNKRAQMSNWEIRDLTFQQIQYAAGDAWLSYSILMALDALKKQHPTHKSSHGAGKGGQYNRDHPQVIPIPKNVVPASGTSHVVDSPSIQVLVKEVMEEVASSCVAG